MVFCERRSDQRPHSLARSLEETLRNANSSSTPACPLFRQRVEIATSRRSTITRPQDSAGRQAQRMVSKSSLTWSYQWSLSRTVALAQCAEQLFGWHPTDVGVFVVYVHTRSLRIPLSSSPIAFREEANADHDGSQEEGNDEGNQNH